MSGTDSGRKRVLIELDPDLIHEVDQNATAVRRHWGRSDHPIDWNKLCLSPAFGLVVLFGDGKKSQRTGRVYLSELSICVWHVARQLGGRTVLPDCVGTFPHQILEGLLDMICWREQENCIE